MQSAQTTELFTEKSDAYAKYRPGYSEDAIDVILAPFKHYKKVSIADIGAGTGIGSRLLANRGAEVTAIEPNAAMIDAAVSHPNITYIQAGAETIPLADYSVDAVTSFQAFHWFNFSKSLREFNRVLKPTGQLALSWNYWDIQDPFTSSYAALIDEATRKNVRRVEPYAGFTGKIKKLRVGLLWKFRHLPYFKNVERHTFTLAEKMDVKGLIGCAQSQSYIDHTGPHWDELIKNIEELWDKNKPCRLMYRINVFTAKPVKKYPV